MNTEKLLALGIFLLFTGWFFHSIILLSAPLTILGGAITGKALFKLKHP